MIPPIIIHILKHGGALCGMPGLPGDWPKGHIWVSFEDATCAGAVNCPECIRARGGEWHSPHAMPGRYDPECREAQRSTGAVAILLVVLKGNKGDGFSVAIDADRANPEVLIDGMPAMLHALAQMIETEAATIHEAKP